jgi:hypothetical protein
MKTLLLILACLTLCLSAKAQQIVTATVTITNNAGTVGGETISVNGILRTWTNTITAANNQILISNNTNTASTNLLLAYASYPAPQVNIFRSGSNSVSFQSFPGFPLVILTNSTGTKWASVTFFTNTITNMTVFRGFPLLVGNYELTNIANGIEQYFASLAVTNAVPTNAPSMTNFLPIAAFNSQLVALSNFCVTLSVNGTNYTLTASNHLYTFIVAATNGIGPSAYHSDTYYQTHTANLDDWSATPISDLSGLSYLVGNDIELKNPTGPITRFYAQEGGDLSINFNDGNQNFYENGDFTTYIYDHGGQTRFAAFDPSQLTGGPTYLSSASGNTDLIIGGLSDEVNTFAPLSFYTEHWPATAIGTTTNFLADAPNSGTSETAVNQFNVPANSMTNVNDTLMRTISLTFSAAGSYEVKVYFASDTIFDTGTITVASTATMSITAEISLDTTSSFRSNTHAEGEGCSQNLFSRPSSGNSIDFTTAQICKVGVKGPASGNVKVTMDNVRLAPSPAWSGFN